MITVKQLIEELQILPQDTIIMVPNRQGNDTCANDIYCYDIKRGEINIDWLESENSCLNISDRQRVKELLEEQTVLRFTRVR